MIAQEILDPAVWAMDTIETHRRHNPDAVLVMLDNTRCQVGGEYAPYVAQWFDGDHEAPALIADGDTFTAAVINIAEALVENIPLD